MVGRIGSDMLIWAAPVSLDRGAVCMPINPPLPGDSSMDPDEVEDLLDEGRLGLSNAADCSRVHSGPGA